ncbi:hypothetical protein HK098_003255 [Nowakowskiella sp. JEL0407]|nr:hypothetical protein HK098_003255 [Nowakowskiella sp. JEL0407]
MSDIFGRAVVMNVTIALFLIGSIVCAVSQRMSVIIDRRAIQGIGGGGMTIMVFQRLISLFRILFLYIDEVYGNLLEWQFLRFPSLVGPVIGGLLSDQFWINVPLCILSICIIAIFLRLPTLAGTFSVNIKRVDFLGISLFIPSVISFLLGIYWGSESWVSIQVIASLVLSLLLMIAFVYVELKIAKELLISDYVWSSRNFVVIYQISATRSGLWIIAPGATGAICTIISRIFISITGYYRTWISAGMVLLTISTILLGFISPAMNSAIAISFSVVCGIGLGCTLQPLMIVNPVNAPAEDMGAVSGLYTFVRSIGGSVALSLMGSQNRISSIADISIASEPIKDARISIYSHIFASMWFCYLAPTLGVGILVSLFSELVSFWEEETEYFMNDVKETSENQESEMVDLSSSTTTIINPQVQISKFQFTMLMFGVVIAFLLINMDATMLAITLPKIAHSFGESDKFSWVGVAYVLTGTATQPIVGKISDIFGRAVVMNALNVLFLVESVICASSFNMNMLIIGRAIQGLGGGMTPMAYILISDFVLCNNEACGSRSGLTYALFSLIAPSIGGAFADRLTWRWVVYWGGNTYPWVSIPVLVSMALSIPLLIGFLYVENKVAIEPIIPHYVWVTRNFAINQVLSFAVGAGFNAFSFYMPTIFQVVYQVSALESGLWLMAPGASGAIFTIVSGIAISRTGKYRIWITFRFISLAISTALLVVNQANAPPEDMGAVSGLYTFMRSVGGTVTLLIMGTILNNEVKRQLDSISPKIDQTCNLVSFANVYTYLDPL